MRRLLFSAALAVALSACTIATPSKIPPAGSVVKILAGGGHGSGVHIGKQLVVTSAHVVADDDGKFMVKADDASTVSATVLWANKTHDVALLRLDRPANIATAKLACREPVDGEALTSRGSPGSIEFVTTYGRVAGLPRKHASFESVFVFDGTIAPGMSGGGVFDSRGEVLGINAAVMVVPLGFTASLMPISYVVPSSTICMLLGK